MANIKHRRTVGPKRFYDYSLLFCIIFLSVIGLVMIYSASSTQHS